MNTNLKISNVTKIYPGCVANDNVSLEFNSGKIYALLGENGAGKSTIADLIPRFYDVKEGSISIDGQDIKNLKIKSLRNLLGIVGQEVILFNDSIKNNLLWGNEYSDEN